MSELSASNVVNVTIETTPSGLSEPNVNSVAIYTQDQPSNNEAYGVYISASAVESNYGTDSVTTQMANNVFAQTPNLLSGEGQLVIIPLIAAVSATAGFAVTADISANLAAIKAVTNGDINVRVNGVDNNITNLNFTNCETWSDVAAVLQAKIIDADVIATANGLQFTSHKVGTTSTIQLAVDGTGTGTDLSGVGYFNAAAETATAGQNSTGETMAQCRARTASQVGYVGIMTTMDLEDGAISAFAPVVQANDNIFLQHVACTQDIAGIGTTIKNAGQTRTRILLYTPGLALANLEKAAYAGRSFSTDFSGSNTAQTLNLKQLVNVVPDPGISQTLYSAALIAGVDLYCNYQGVPSVLSTGANQYFDAPYGDLWLKFALQQAGFDYLRQTNTKIPQTEAGMTGLKDAYAGVCELAATNDSIAPGTWNSPDTFGDPTIFKNNIKVNGYYVYSLPISQQSEPDRQARKAPLVQIAIKRSGAIHTSNVIVLVND